MKLLLKTKRNETQLFFNTLKRLSIYLLLLFIFTLIIKNISSTAQAADTMRILLLDAKNSKIPQKNEKVERLGYAEGDVLLSGLKYSGIIEVWKGENGLYVINELPLEDYVKGVVAGEVGKDWEMEALKAQAVAARTYAVYQKNKNGINKNMFYDITSSVMHQVYKGGDIPENIKMAVESTRGEILTYDGEPILALYHSTSGGMTEDPVEVFGQGFPYLMPVETSCELSPYSIWERKISVAEIERATNLKDIKDIYIESYTVSNRAKTLIVVTESEQKAILAKDLRKELGWDKLPSTMLTNIIKKDDLFIFEGKGYGHGVGMCQWTALDMAKNGMNYREILSKFYPGTVISLINNH